MYCTHEEDAIGVPLAALAIRPPQQQEDPGQQIAKAVAIRSAMQNQQMGSVELQQRQIQLQQQQADQQAFQAANQQWKANDQGIYDQNDFLDLARKNGATPQTLLKLQQSVLDREEKQSVTRKNNAQAAADQAKLTSDKMQKVAADMENLKSLPPDQYQPALAQLLQQRVQDGTFTAQEAQQSLQIPQSALDGLQKHILGEKAYNDNQHALAQAEQEKQNANLAKMKAGLLEKQMSSGQMVGEGFDVQAANDWMARNPGKTISDYQVWKAKNATPSAMVLQNLIPPGSALDQQAELYSQTHELPQGFSRSPGTTAAIIKRAAELHPEQNLAANQAEYKSLSGSLTKLQTTFNQVSAFEGTALRNLDLYAQKLQAVPDLGMRFANVPVRMLSAKVVGSDAMAAMNAARQTAATEAAKVLGSATASGVLSDSQKREALDVLDGNLSVKASLAVINTLKQDFANRHQSYQLQIQDLQGKLGNKPPSSGKAGTTKEDPLGIR